jgi:Gpi18-like mannosyltransferase
LLFDHWTADIDNAVGIWYKTLKHAGFSAFSQGFYIYTPLYLYFLYLSSVIFGGLKTIIAIKLSAALCDYLCAFVVYKLVRWGYQKGPVPVFAFFATLFLPTVFINSSMWGQADVFYTTALLACVYAILSGRDYLAWICFGIAFAFKLQAFFIVPLLIVLILKRRLVWYKAWTVPAVYFLSILPTWWAGRPLRELLFIYFGQFDHFRVLSANAPTMFAWFPNEFYTYLVPVGFVVGLSACFLYALVVYKSKTELTGPIIIQLATLSVMFLPFFLPKMHDRYFFPADVFALVFAFYYPKFSWVAIAIELSSLFAYFPYLFGKEIFPIYILALIVLAAIIGLVWSLKNSMTWEGTDLKA